MSEAKKSSGAGFLTLFGIPFLGVGIVTLYLLIQQIAEGPEDGERFLLLCIFPAVFGGVGLAMIVGGRWAARKVREEEQLKRLHPDAPWMWKPDWAQGRVRGGGQQIMWFAWGFAAIWNLISFPLIFKVPDEVAGRGNYAALLGLLFPLVGVFLIVWALKATARYRRFGVSEMEMTTLPGVVGGRLQGTICSGLKKAPEQLKIVLSSIRRIERKGKNSSTSESILWQDEYTLSPGDLQQGRRGLCFPIDFAIPRDARQTDESNSRNKVIWRLEAGAELAGVDYHTQIEVPVFETADSSELVQEPSRFAAAAAEKQEEVGSQTTRIEIGPSPLGGQQFYFPAARNPGTALGLTVFTAIFGGVTVGMLIWGFSGNSLFSLFNLLFMLFSVVFGLFSLLLVVFTLDAWFGTTTVVIEDGRLRARHAILGLGSWKEISCGQIADVKIGIGMQQNQTMTQSAKAYYDIEVHPETGRRFKAGGAIRNKREAEWLAEQMSMAVLTEA